MPIYLDNDFYKNIETEFKKYANDHEKLSERARIIAEQDEQIVEKAEESLEILETFGAIK